MLDAFQAETIAFITDGGIIHYECLSEDWTSEAAAEAKASGVDRMFFEFLEQAGITPLSRFSIHEDEGERAYDVEQYPQGYSDDLVDLIARRDRFQGLFDELKDSEEGRLPGMDVLEDEIQLLNDEIEELVDDLSKVICDQCGNPIE